MNRSRIPRLTFLLLASVAFLIFTLGLHAQTAGPVQREIPTSGQGTFQPQPMGADGIQLIEIDDLGQDADNDDSDTGFINRTLSTAQPGNGSSVRAGKKAKSNPELILGFDGLNFRNILQPVGSDEFRVLSEVIGFRGQRRSSRK
jgi:hypothetical protein